MADHKAHRLPAPKPGSTPHWDGQWNEISLNDEVFERFKRRAPASERILGSFEDDGWKSRIDDPLDPVLGHSAQQRATRLRVQVEALNRRLKSGLLRFEMDGTGTGVCWCWVINRTIAAVKQQMGNL